MGARFTGLGLLVWGVSIVTFGYLLVPLFVVVVAPLGDTGYLAFPPQGLTLKWYRAALADTHYIDAALTSAVIAGIVATISSVAGTAASLALVRFRFPGRRLLVGVFMSPLFLPTVVLALALSIHFAANPVGGGRLRLMIAHLTVCLPYVIRITMPILQRLDRGIEEAAINLGAHPAHAFFLVTLPIIWPSMLVVFGLSFIFSFDEVELAVFLAPPRHLTLPVRIYSDIQLGFEPSVAAVSGLLVLASGTAIILIGLVRWIAGRGRET